MRYVFPNKYQGGTDGSEYDEILEFDPLTGQWKLVDRMIQARHAHAVSVIDFDSGRVELSHWSRFRDTVI